jgi:hypothetical protein
LSIFIVLANFDVSGTIFKVLQIINLFDKLRLLNIRMDGLIGKFLESLSRLFENSLIEKDDYHIVAKPRGDRFYQT